MAIPNWNLQYHIDKRTPFTIGEIYRCILAHLTEKEIKKALLKYRDLMPRNSDWNRKLTQATDIPEIGFRYLYRCGQIDESNHKTMQKMLKYVDRLDVLPFFDTLLYDSALDNKSLPLLKANLVNSEHALLLQLINSHSYKQVFSEPYVLQKLSGPLGGRKTRSWAKRRCYDSSSFNRDSLSPKGSNPTDGNTESKRGRFSDFLTLPSYMELLHGSNHYPAANNALPIIMRTEKENIQERQKLLRQQAPWLHYNWAVAENFELSRGVSHMIHQIFNDAYLDTTHMPLHPVLDKVNNDPIIKAVSPVTPHGHFSTHHVTLCVRLHVDIYNLRPVMLAAFTHLNQLYEAQLEMYRDTVDAIADRQVHGSTCLVTFSSLEDLDLFWHYYCAGHLENAIHRLLYKKSIISVWKEMMKGISADYKIEGQEYQLISQHVHRGALMKVFIQEEDYIFARCVLLNKQRRQWAPELVPPIVEAPQVQEDTSEAASALKKQGASRQSTSSQIHSSPTSPVTRAASVERTEQQQPQQQVETPAIPVPNEAGDINPVTTPNVTKIKIDPSTFSYKEVPLGANLDERALMDLYGIKGLDHPWFTHETSVVSSTPDDEFFNSVTYLYRSMNPLSETNEVSDHVFPWLIS